MPATTHKISSSSHKLFHEVLRFSNLYVVLALGYGTLLIGAALQASGVPVGLLLGLQVAPLERPQGSVGAGLVRSGALSLATAGVVGVLVGFMVRRCCRFDRRKSLVVTNWHDLFKYTHMGRTITAAMTAVLTWRGLTSLNDFKTSEGGVGVVPALLIAAAVLSMATAAAMHFLHFKMKGLYFEYGKLKRA
ncbi:unnamed protein product [Scytosiphon promiscuus]